jgi:hypothetical protein
MAASMVPTMACVMQDCMLVPASGCLLRGNVWELLSVAELMALLWGLESGAVMAWTTGQQLEGTTGRRSDRSTRRSSPADKHS